MCGVDEEVQKVTSESSTGKLDMQVNLIKFGSDGVECGMENLGRHMRHMSHVTCQMIVYWSTPVLQYSTTVLCTCMYSRGCGKTRKVLNPV